MMLSLLLVLGACNEKDKQEPETSGNNSQSGQEGTPSFDGDEGTVDGHAWVSLGLPSGTLWATCNIGADSPEEYGDYFAWGETEPKTDYGWSTYNYGTSSSTLTKYCNNSSKGLVGYADTLTVLEAADDAATANWGSAWRMPTIAEIEELYNNCTNTWTSLGGKEGRLFTGANGKTILLPAAGSCMGSEPGYVGAYGYYWSKLLYTDNPGFSCNLYCSSDNVGHGYTARYYGLPVRPVVNR